MKIISLAWTAGAFAAGRKSVTRRQWVDRYAALFRAGDICQAYDKSPRRHGKRIGYLEIISVTREMMCQMPDSDYEAEGFAWMEEQGLQFRGVHPRLAFEQWRYSGAAEKWWVIRFRKVDGPAEDRSTTRAKTTQ